jgi:hypothetical protein
MHLSRTALEKLFHVTLHTEIELCTKKPEMLTGFSGVANHDACYKWLRSFLRDAHRLARGGARLFGVSEELSNSASLPAGSPVASLS